MKEVSPTHPQAGNSLQNNLCSLALDSCLAQMAGANQAEALSNSLPDALMNFWTERYSLTCFLLNNQVLDLGVSLVILVSVGSLKGSEEWENVTCCLLC